MRPPILDDALSHLCHLLCDVQPGIADSISEIVSEIVSGWLHDRQLMAQALMLKERDLAITKELLVEACVRAMPPLSPRFLVEGQDRGYLPPLTQTKLPAEGIAALLSK